MSRAYSLATSPTARSCPGRQPPTVDPDAQHEVLVVELLRLEHRGLAAFDAGARWV